MLLSYLVLLFIVLTYFESSIFTESITFLLVNLGIGALFLYTINPRPSWPFYSLILLIYFVVYIVKAIVLNIRGFNTKYIFVSIRVFISEGDYLNTLEIITLGHLVVFLTLVCISYLPEKSHSNAQLKAYLKSKFIPVSLLSIFIWTLFTSIVMYKYGVAVMGTESVSLPYRLSGVFFYSRTILVPFLLLYLLEKSLIKKDSSLRTAVISLFIFLAASEIVVRTTKAPLFIILLLLIFMIAILRARGALTGFKINRKFVLLLSLSALFAFPFIEIYRHIFISGEGFSYAMDEYLSSAVTQDSHNFIFLAIERLLHRLVGFTQLAGLVSMDFCQADLTTIFHFDNLARYYTENCLGYNIEGHLSSPSLLGAALILGGSSYWPLLFMAWLLAIVLLWRISSLFHNCEVVLKCFLAYETFNMLMAGTVDASITRCMILFPIAFVFELFLEVAKLKDSSGEKST